MKKSAIVVLGVMMSGSSFVFADNTPAPAASAPASTEVPSAAPSQPAGATIKVEKIAIGTAVTNREIVGESDRFGGGPERLYCWTKISTDQSPVTIKHVWSIGGQKEADIPLQINSSAARTWSTKGVRPGSWKVDVTDGAGKVLASKEFTVTQEAAAPAAAPPPQVGQ